MVMDVIRSNVVKRYFRLVNLLLPKRCANENLARIVIFHNIRNVIIFQCTENEGIRIYVTCIFVMVSSLV